MRTNSPDAGRKSVSKMSSGVFTNRKADIFWRALRPKPWSIALWPKAESIGRQRSQRAIWRAATLEGSDLWPTARRIVADRYVFACGPWLGKMFPANRRPTFCFDQAGSIFLRHSRRRYPLRRGQHSRCGQITASTSCMEFPETRDAVSRWPTTRAEPEFDPTSGERLVSEEGAGRGTPLSRLPFPGDERCAAARDARLPVRKYHRPQLHRRSPSSQRKCVDRWRRLGPRLQAWSRDRRDGGRTVLQRMKLRNRYIGWQDSRQKFASRDRNLPRRKSDEVICVSQIY